MHSYENRSQIRALMQRALNAPAAPQESGLDKASVDLGPGRPGAVKQPQRFPI
jgi:hypothetical protein